ncbi:ADP-ribosylglycohydrolase [Microthyrium microscopicum]|uniref:ADP-ribosylglycohydrolase n=1 Tax=Microthyrium microscopicum TaxID=703497 RepID=A0A6A6TU42_9PEZI|nr:ADP-ribosylglycohydrolase [Microthyrium microscopicum]
MEYVQYFETAFIPDEKPPSNPKDRLYLEGMHDRALGCIFGSALGDAIGLYTEFMTREDARNAYPEAKFSLVTPVTPRFKDEHRARFPERSWTDDTDHALLIVLSYLRNEKLDPRDVAYRLWIWAEQGTRALDRMPLGLGQTTSQVLEFDKYALRPEDFAYQVWHIHNFQSAPNGSLMRTHPLGILCLSHTLEETFEIAANFSNITHPDPRCIVSCCIGTALVRALVTGLIVDVRDINRTVVQASVWCARWLKKQRVLFPDRVYPDLDMDELFAHTRNKVYPAEFNLDPLGPLRLDEDGKVGYVYKTLGAGIAALRLALEESDGIRIYTLLKT